MAPPQPAKSGVNSGGVIAAWCMVDPAGIEYSVASMQGVKPGAELSMILAKATAKPKIGLHHHGQKMSLKAFEFAQVEDDYIAELARGYLVVSEVANYYHGMQIIAIKRLLGIYDVEHRGTIHAIFGTMECKLLIPDWESERHPDIA